MCIRREPAEVYAPVAELDDQIDNLRELVAGVSRPYGCAWVGGVAFYALLDSV